MPPKAESSRAEDIRFINFQQSEDSGWDSGNVLVFTCVN